MQVCFGEKGEIRLNRIDIDFLNLNIFFLKFSWVARITLSSQNMSILQNTKKNLLVFIIGVKEFQHILN